MKVAAAERKKENKYNILSGALIAFALCFTLFIYAPYELYVTNQLEFWFTAGQMACCGVCWRQDLCWGCLPPPSSRSFWCCILPAG